VAKRRSYRTLDGSRAWELVRPEDGSERMSVARARVDAGQRTLAHRHRTSDEVYYVLSGDGTVVVAGCETAVRPGDVVLIPAGAEHWVASGHRGLELLCLCSPPYEHDDTDLTGTQE